ncbi:EAL domain-containing protein [Lentzea sp. NBRC 102530]|uniref:putative bifunctional diguanylate cyclase/phosphodiesterase n=1 Tax=Lentzea sp. NBRC 102530 TaxID=3032201 RepID=UPI0024A05DFE|nr:EAL domain-containing protein [Lentzea sp. NBRC 102530]GLY54678.1 signal transduction protein [Lentzea sp. NBRC 102530]
MTLARKWSYKLLGSVAIPLGRDDLDQELALRLDALCSMLHAEPFATTPIEGAGADLATLGHLGKHGLRCTAEVLGKGLLALPEFQPVSQYAERIALAMGALGAGFTAANAESVLAQQESMQRSLLKAVRDANWNLKESEARFNEVVTSSTNGVLIVDLDGGLNTVNEAIGEILGRTPDELVGTPLLDLIEPAFTEMLRDAMTDLAAGVTDRVQQSQRLLREDGESARVTLTASMLRGADGKPNHFVVVVEDGTELELLQSELKRQSLHDPLTGLPNRQFFTTQLETALRKADPEHGITVFHLDLDAFGMLRDSFGGRVVERYLQHVSGRLKALLAGEKVMIARFGGDEFGILLENTASTPRIDTIMKSINADLMSEPTFVDGHGLSASMSAGVVHRPSSDTEPLDVLRSAERSLRRAKKGRRGQWELFHAGQDAEERRDDALAVAMPAAWEDGEITVRYRPVVRLATGTVAGVEAELFWDAPSGQLDHDRCAGLAEQTGLILPLGGWLLKVAGGQAAWWRQREQFDLPLAVRLTAHQASDADLVSRVVEVLDGIGVPPEMLMVSVPGGVLVLPDAVDNLAVLTRMNVLTAIDDFGMGPLDFGLLASDVPVRAVRIARDLVASRSPYVAALLPLLRERGVRIAVEGIEDAEQAAWWRDAGADFATGDHFGVAREAGEFLLDLR